MSKEVLVQSDVNVVPGIGAMDETDNSSLSNFAQLIQKTSKSLDTIEGAKVGDIMDSAGNKLNDKPFIAVFKFNMFTKFRPQDEGGGVEWRTTNSKDQRVVEGMIWEKDKKGKTIKPAVSKASNIIAVFNDDFENPIIIPFRSTSLKTLGLMIKQAIKDKALYFRTYSVSSEKTERNGYTYQVMTYKTGKPLDKKLVAKAKEAYDQHLADYNRMSSFISSAEVKVAGEEDLSEEHKEQPAGNGKKKRPF